MFSIIAAAGWPIWPLFICSILGLAIIFERSYSLRASVVVPEGLLEQTLEVLRKKSLTSEVIDSLRSHSPLGRVLATGLATSYQSTAEQRQIEDAMEEGGRMVAHELHRGLPALVTVASIAPLLGLLGTVVGMIEIFGSQSPGGGSNPIVLAQGISIALYNTAFGLIVCVPALVAHRILRSKVDDFVLQLEIAARRVADEILIQRSKTR